MIIYSIEVHKYKKVGQFVLSSDNKLYTELLKFYLRPTVFNIIVGYTISGI